MVSSAPTGQQLLHNVSGGVWHKERRDAHVRAVGNLSTQLPQSLLQIVDHTSPAIHDEDRLAGIVDATTLHLYDPEESSRIPGDSSFPG
jgi:hypothetical protein